MSEAMLARCRIQSAKEERVRAWFAELREREDEVVETLQHEGVYTETGFVASFDDEPYLFVYMEAEDLDAADEAGDEEAYDIDEEHHAVFAECLSGEWEELDTIGHFTNPALRAAE